LVGNLLQIIYNFVEVKKMNLGEKLLEFRKRKGLSQEQVADKIGVSRQTVSKWETDQSLPDFDKLLPLSELYDVTLDELAGNNKNIKRDDDYIHLKNHYEYKSKKSIFGLPIVHINIGRGLYKAKGLIAIGNISVGLISIGMLSLGLLSFGVLAFGLVLIGALALGVISCGAIAVGVFAIGGCAIGIFAIGGLAIGVYSIGGCAIATNIALGDYASGHIAIGHHTHGYIKLVRDATSVDYIRSSILHEFPHIWKFVVDIFCSVLKWQNY
jgi:transcriptional regulator with XRE-family HTH domain